MSKTPKLRFPEFSGEWEEYYIGELGKFFKGSGLSKADLANEGSPCILYGELYTKYNEVIEKATSKTNVNSDKLVKSIKNDVLIPSSGETAIDIATASCVQEDGIILGGDLNIFRSNDINGIFLSYQLNNSKRKEIAKLAQGASVVHLYNDSLKKVKIDLPGKQEQQKIASFLSLVDKKIEKQSEKVEAIKEYKKGMMQKIFSREIRFKDDEGKEFPEWEEKKLGDIIYLDLEPVEKPSEAYWRLGIRSHGKGTFYEYIEDPNDVNMDTLYKVKRNTLIVNITFAWEHAIAITNEIDEGKLVSHRFPTYSFYTKALYSFYKYYFLRALFKYQLGNASPGGAGRNRVLNKNEFLKIPVILPILQEQQKIANFLSTIDKKLEKEEEKLEALRTWKKGLLQQMFV